MVLAERMGTNQIGVERMEWQRQQPRLLFGEGLRHGAAIVARPRALMGDLVTPEQGLTIALFQRGEVAAGPEGFAHVTNGAFDAAFLITGPNLAGTSDAVIVSAQFQQTGMKVDLIAAPFQHGTAEIVMKNHTRLARPSLKGVNMAAQEVLHALIEEELQIQRSRVGKGDDKAGQTPAGTTDHDFAEVRPVDLRLLGRKDMQAQERFRPSGPQVGHGTPQLDDAALIAALADHLVDAGGAQSGILVQGLADEG